MEYEDNTKDENINENNDVNDNTDKTEDVSVKEKEPKVLTPEQLEKRRKLRRVIIIAASIILPALIIFIVKQVQISKMRKAHTLEISLIKEDASKYVKNMNENNLKIISRVLSWAVSDAITSGQLKDAAEYMILTVKENNFKQIMVVNPEGMVIMSTDKKLEGNPFVNPFPDEALPADSVKLRTLPSGDYMIASSMYKVDVRHGVLIITASPDSIPFKENYSNNK